MYEAEGFELLCDPWLTDGAFEGSWFHYPPVMTTAEDLLEVDALYISHLHPDHLDRQLLSQLKKDIPIVIYRDEPFLYGILKGLGFRNFVTIGDGETVSLGPFKLTMYGPFVRHPFFECEIGNLVDSALVVEWGKLSVLNTNDNTPSLEAAKMLKARHPNLTVAQLNYNAAGPYPSCFIGVNRMSEHTRILDRNISHMLRVAEILAPDFVMPFAGQYVLGGKQSYKNEFLGTTSIENAAQAIEDAGMHPLILNEASSIDLANCVLSDGSDHYIPTNKEAETNYIEQVLAEKKYPYETDKEVCPGEMWALCSIARDHLWRAQEKYNYFPVLEMKIFTPDIPNTGFQFNLNNPASHEIEAPSGWMPLGLAAYLDSRLLMRILTKQAHWNNAEIGCHIDYRREPNDYRPDVHLLMSFFHA